MMPVSLLYLASNRNIDQEIFEMLLDKEEEVVHELMRVLRYRYAAF